MTRPHRPGDSPATERDGTASVESLRPLSQASRLPLWQRPSLRLAGILGLCWLALCLPLLLGSHSLPWDALDEFYPTVYFNAHSLRHGLAPWWNPYIYAGYPQIADPQGMLFSPLLMIWMLLPSDPGSTWFAWGVLLHGWMGGLALLALLRRFQVNRFGALIGALVFMAGGVAASRIEHVPMMLAYGYAPVALLALHHFAAMPGVRRGVLAGLAVGAMATQLVQLTYLLGWMLLGYAVAGALAHWRRYDRAARWRWIFGALLAATVALLLAAPQLVFSVSFVGLSNRSVLPLAAAAPASLDARALLTLLDPNALHGLRGDYAGPASRVESYLFLGAIPSLLLLAGLGRAWRVPRQRRQLLFFAGTGMLVTLYMLGVHTPFYGWLYTWLPGMPQFRRPSDAAFLLQLALAVMAGAGAGQFDLSSRRQLGWLLGAATLWLGLASLHMRDDGVSWQAWTMLAAGVALLALWRLQRGGGEWRAAGWLLLVLVADYRCFNLNGSFNEGPNSAHHFLRDATVDALVTRLKTPPDQLPSRIETVHTSVYWDNYVVLRGIASTQGYNPLRYGLYDRWYGARDNGNLPRVATSYSRGPDSALTALLGVGYLVRGTDTQTASWAPPAGYTRIFEGKHAQLWRNDRAYARILLPSRATLLPLHTEPSPAAFAATDFHHSLWLTPRDAEDARRSALAMQRCNGRLHSAAAQAVTPTRLQLRTDGAAGWLVLAELDFPGWQARIDDVPAPILRANGMFRALCVPAGTHAVELRFDPWQMVLTAWRHRHRNGS